MIAGVPLCVTASDACAAVQCEDSSLFHRDGSQIAMLIISIAAVEMLLMLKLLAVLVFMRFSQCSPMCPECVCVK